MISKLKNCLHHQFVKFLLVGGINTVFGCTMFSFFIFLNLPFQLANLFTLILGVLFNFKTTGILVFRSHNNALIFKFLAVYLISYAVSTSGLAIFHHYGFVNIHSAFIIMVIPTTIMTYLLLKSWVFTSQCNSNEPLDNICEDKVQI